MKAAVCYEPNTPLRIEEVELDSPQANEVLVKMAATGICHSDLHFLKGEMPAAMPVVMGHEGAGVVSQVGPGVTSLKPGDHVVMAVAFSCGNCSYCREGRPTMCVENMPVMAGAVLPMGGGTRLHKDGQPLHHLFGLASFAEYTVVHERSAIKVRDDAPFEVVCLLGCGVSTGLGAAMNTAAIKPGESIAIFGCGGVGLSAIMGAKLAGAGKIIAVDMLDRKLRMAKKLGADFAVNASKEDPMGKIMEVTGSGADYAIECIGNVNVMAQAFASIRYGGKCIVAGMAPLGTMFSVAPFEFLLGKTVTGTVQGDIRGSIDIPRYIDLYMVGKLPLDKLISKYYTLDEINLALEALGKGETIRGVIRFPGAD